MKRILLISPILAGMLYVAFLIWNVQPDRSLLRELRQDANHIEFSEMEPLFSQNGFETRHWDYYALAQYFSGEGWPKPDLFMSESIKAEFLSLCTVFCQLTIFERNEIAPHFGFRHRYKFYVIRQEDHERVVLTDHVFLFLTWP